MFRVTRKDEHTCVFAIGLVCRMALPLLFAQFTGWILQFLTTAEAVFFSGDVVWLLWILPELGN